MKQNNAETDKNPDRYFKFQITSAIGISLLIIFVLGVFAVYQTHIQHLEEKINNTMNSVINLYQHTLNSEANQIAAILEVIVESKTLRDALAKKDRNKLLKNNAPLFKLIKEHYNITHFYFTGIDRVNIVRIHNPPRYGDIINRFTTIEAERTGKLFSGVEMGASGMFTLRVVEPVFDGSNLIGYVELGREIGHIINEVSYILQVDLYVTLNKNTVNRAEWEKGMQQMGQETHWDQFPKLLLTNSTATLNEQVKASLSKTENPTYIPSHQDTFSYNSFKKYYNKSTFTLFTPLKDVAGLEIGNLVVYLDFTEMTDMAFINTREFALLGISLVLIILIFIFLILSRIQRSMVNYREQELKDVRLREVAQQELEDAHLRELAQQEHMALMNEKTIEIEEQGNRMATIIDKAVDGIITIDSGGLILTFNHAAGRMFGYSPEEIIGQKLKQLMPEPDHSQADGYLMQYMKSGRRNIINKPQEVLGQTKQGKKFPILLSVSEVVMKGEQTFVGIVHDISDRKRAETAMRLRNEGLERSNKDLENFAYVASHDLQEPLRKIRAFGDRLQQRASGQFDEKSQDYLNRMLNAATRMQALISDLLSFSRLGTATKPFEKVILSDIITGVVSDLETQIEKTSATLNIGEMPVIEADALQMRQLFQNLIGNAIKFQRKDIPPVVTIKAQLLVTGSGSGYVQVPQWEITVSDNGVGFDDKYTALIFEVFQRLHNRGVYDGTGIGLAICRKIIERHEGSIQANSKPNEGATFRIVLPEKQERKTEDWLEPENNNNEKYDGSNE